MQPYIVLAEGLHVRKRMKRLDGTGKAAKGVQVLWLLATVVNTGHMSTVRLTRKRILHPEEQQLPPLNASIEPYLTNCGVPVLATLQRNPKLEDFGFLASTKSSSDSSTPQTV
jgi:hypothetical protein